MADKVVFEVEGPIAVISNNNPGKRNAFDDEMDVLLFEILGEIKDRRDIRVVIWRAEGKAWSAGRDTSVIGHNATKLSHHELMTRGHQWILQVFDLDIPIIAAIQGWAIGGSFQRALLCDIRIAAEGTRFMLPELGYGVIPDTGGMGRLYQICGTGVASDLIFTGRVMGVDEAYGHGIVSRVVAPEKLDETAFEMANKIASAPMVTVKMARRVLQHLSEPGIRSSMEDELIYQTFINKSTDFAEFKAAKSEGRKPDYSGNWEYPPSRRRHGDSNRWNTLPHWP
jgi:enoyl-CoA hydratase